MKDQSLRCEPFHDVNAHYSMPTSSQKDRQALYACADDQGPGYLGTHCDGRDLGCVRLRLAVGAVSAYTEEVPPTIPAVDVAMLEDVVACIGERNVSNLSNLNPRSYHIRSHRW